MGADNAVFLEQIEWFDDTGEEFVRRLPEQGSGDIKWGAQLTVRESQAAVFFYKGKAVGAFGAGRHTLKTANIPILTKMASLPWGFESPLRAEVYFTNLKTFTNLKWGTRDPVAFRDDDLGLVRLRAFGIFNLRITQPVLFINRLVGTKGVYTTEEISDYLNRVVVSRFNDFIGERFNSIFELPSRYDELADGLAERLKEDFSRFGLSLTTMYINSITPPPEVQQAIDDKSRLGVFDDMNKLMKMKAAMAMEKMSESEGGGAGAEAGIGMGLGVMLPGMFAGRFSEGQSLQEGNGQQAGQTSPCPECGNTIPADARFCPQCGHQQVIFEKCEHCGKNITPGANFCPRCGKSTGEKTEKKFCAACGAENLPESVFCDRCGEKH